MTILDAAVALSDRDLLARIPILAAHERTATSELVAHLAALRLRPSLYAAQGYGSLFAYCRHALRLSEDAASNRIHAARACLKFPVIVDLLASGGLSLSAVRMLRPHLTLENHERVLGRARNARRADIERLLAELAPRPDVPSSVRKAPMPRNGEPQAGLAVNPSQGQLPAELVTSSGPTRAMRPGSNDGSMTPPSETAVGEVNAARPAASSGPRPLVQPLSPERYRVQFTIGQDTHDILRRVQTLLRREIPDGDAGAIFERALRLLHKEVEAARFGRAPKRRQDRVTRKATAIAPEATGAYENRIRPGADGKAASPSRYIPKGVKRAVWYRDRGQCAFVSASGQRCVEREFLELHHIHPYALHGPTTIGNIALRCRRHNAYEAEVVFGARRMPVDT